MFDTTQYEHGPLNGTDHPIEPSGGDDDDDGSSSEDDPS